MKDNDCSNRPLSNKAPLVANPCRSVYIAVYSCPKHSILFIINRNRVVCKTRINLNCYFFCAGSRSYIWENSALSATSMKHSSCCLSKNNYGNGQLEEFVLYLCIYNHNFKNLKSRRFKWPRKIYVIIVKHSSKLFLYITTLQYIPSWNF